MAQLLQYDPTALVELPTAGRREAHRKCSIWVRARVLKYPSTRDVGQTIVAISSEFEARVIG